MSELKPCPFCGSEAAEPIFIGNDHTRKRKVTIRCKAPGCTQGVTVGAVRFSHEWCHQEAVKAWNTRSTDEELTAAYFEASRSAEAIAALQERNADLEDALWPFAEARPRGLAHVPDDAVYAATVKIGDLRRAAALLNKEAS